MAKSSGGMKNILLEKGELIALIGSGVFAFLLLIWGVGALATAGAPVSVTQIDSKAKGLESGIRAPGESAPAQPEWVDKAAGYPAIPSDKYALAGSTFEPIHQPDMLRENPGVLGVDDYQIDLVRAPMPALDIRNDDGKITIGVLTAAPQGAKMDSKELRESLSGALKNFQGRPVTPPRRQPRSTQPTGGAGSSAGPQPGAGQGPGSSAGPAPMGPPSAGGGSSLGPVAGGGGTGPRGGGSYDPYGAMGTTGTNEGAAGLRDDKTITYMTPEEVEKKGLPLAKTVYPLRMLIVHAAVPLSAQRNEIRRALRLPDVKNAQGQITYNPEVEPIYDGFEVDRRLAPPGADINQSPWTEFNHYDEYYSKIRARKIADQPDSDYLSLFFRYEQKMAAPLPMLADQLGSYGQMRIESINRVIKKMEDDRKPKPTVTDWNRRFQSSAGTGENPYAPAGTNSFGGMNQPGLGGATGPMGIPPIGGGTSNQLPGSSQPYPGMPGNGTQAPPTLPEIDHILMRFLDTDVKPGFTYQYRVRLRMKNPNFKQTGKVGRDDDAKIEFLNSVWVEIPEKVTIPNESFLYAYDANKYLDYVKTLSESSGKEPQIAKLLEERDVREGKKTVVQVQTWMEKIRIDSGNKTEPVGTWVVSAMPVGPGDYIGRRQLVELPLWSSGIVNYVLRELAGGVKVAGLTNQKNQPKGWPINFRTQSILVDFDGGKSKNRINDKDVFDDSASELLILRADGKLLVRSSADDMDEKDRAKRNNDWDDWLSRVKLRKDLSVTPAEGSGGTFIRPPTGGGK